MNRMGRDTGIDHSPLDGISDVISQPFSVGSRNTVDPKHFTELWRLCRLIIHKASC
jgi:hypothetical protein